MAFVQATIWLAGCGALGYFLLKITAPNEAQSTKELLERSRVGPKPPTGPLGFVQRSTAPVNGPSPIVPPTANPFYPALRREAAATGVSNEDTNSPKTGK